jgi:hypothetical protein
MSLSDVFSSLFASAEAKTLLASLQERTHLSLPTFDLTTTSLRHLNKWLQRLEDIESGRIPERPHGNFFSDPASIGLVSLAKRPYILTRAGKEFLGLKASLANSPARAEYELVRILYSGKHKHPKNVRAFLNQKRSNMLDLLRRFQQTSSAPLFLSHAGLLVIAELVAPFQGALENLLNLDESALLAFESLGEEGFKNLCGGRSYPPGLSRLCKRIGSDYTRGEERRVHFVFSMAILTILSGLQKSTEARLTIPFPFSNLITESTLFKVWPDYTHDISVWFDGESFRCRIGNQMTKSGQLSLGRELKAVAIIPQTGDPSGTGSAPDKSPKRKSIRRSARGRSTIVLDHVLSEQAEDKIEAILEAESLPGYLFRVGHRTGELLAMSDGLVPGADFYVLDQRDRPVQFIEVKAISNLPPAEISLTRAEYMRVLKCIRQGIQYRLYVVDISTGWCAEVRDFSSSVSTLRLEETVQFVIRVAELP